MRPRSAWTLILAAALAGAPALASRFAGIHPSRLRLRSAWTLILAATLMGVPALAFRFAGIHPSTEVEVAIFGLGILSAAFLISTGAEAAQHDIPASLAVAVVAFIAVLPEYAVDLLLAWEAGKGVPGKDELALANMTGANRLLLGVGWATVIFLFAWKAAGPRRLLAATARGVWRDTAALFLFARKVAGPGRLPRRAARGAWRDLHRRPADVVVELAHELVGGALTVDVQRLVLIADAVAGQANDALDEVAAVVGRDEHHDVATLRRAQVQHLGAQHRQADAVGVLVDQDEVPHLQGRGHGL